MANPGLAKKLTTAAPRKKIAAGARIEQLSVRSTTNMPLVQKVKITSAHHLYKPSIVVQSARSKKPSSVVPRAL